MLKFYNNCVGWNPDDVDTNDGLANMIDSAFSISRRQFLQLVDRDELKELEEGLGYSEHHTQGLTMAADYHVSYHTSQLHGKPCAFFKQSAIEHVFN